VKREVALRVYRHGWGGGLAARVSVVLSLSIQGFGFGFGVWGFFVHDNKNVVHCLVVLKQLNTIVSTLDALSYLVLLLHFCVELPLPLL